MAGELGQMLLEKNQRLERQNEELKLQMETLSREYDGVADQLSRLQIEHMRLQDESKDRDRVHAQKYLLLQQRFQAFEAEAMETSDSLSSARQELTRCHKQLRAHTDDQEKYLTALNEMSHWQREAAQAREAEQQLRRDLDRQRACQESVADRERMIDEQANDAVPSCAKRRLHESPQREIQTTFRNLQQRIDELDAEREETLQHVRAAEKRHSLEVNELSKNLMICTQELAAANEKIAQLTAEASAVSYASSYAPPASIATSAGTQAASRPALLSHSRATSECSSDCADDPESRVPLKRKQDAVNFLKARLSQPGSPTLSASNLDVSRKNSAVLRIVDKLTQITAPSTAADPPPSAALLPCTLR
eukprot:gnl/Spiro4/14127_TR7589_c0_g1_i1.p1 gnl/Spiro4/14127_TR7589_c0_g1~~gnl/Spiro4/14127_TR7589_c0_g1_i1.p1  ORF type:complete len:365 (-),score=94.56 gnl/Spiro4/14127_TR7589_c0_g1_i1:3-1097(-)